MDRHLTGRSLQFRMTWQAGIRRPGPASRTVAKADCTPEVAKGMKGMRLNSTDRRRPPVLWTEQPTYFDPTNVAGDGVRHGPRFSPQRAQGAQRRRDWIRAGTVSMPLNHLCRSHSWIVGSNFSNRHPGLSLTLCALCVLCGSPFLVGSPGKWAVAASRLVASRDGWMDETPSGFGTWGVGVPG
jgi:hypothetical protein